jgi:hypothetical protein
MKPNRREVMQAVLDGKLSADHVTMDEIRELETMIMDAIIEKRAQTNAAVVGMANNTLH